MKAVRIVFGLVLAVSLLACPLAFADDFRELRERAGRAAEHHGDIAMQGESARLLFKVAQSNPKSLVDQVRAMQQMDTHLSLLRNVAVDKERKTELLNGYDRMIAHGDKVLAAFPDSAEIMVLRALAFARKGQFQGITRSISVIKPTFRALNHAYETDPAALDGLGPLVMGRMYFEVPGLLGGDTDLSIRYLEEAFGYRPKDVTAMRFLAESYRDDGEKKKAAAMLAKIIPAQLSTKRQEAADELFAAAGLARKWKLCEMEEKIREKRRLFMSENPGLMDKAKRK